MNRLSRLAPLTVVIALFAAACGSSAEDAANASDTTTAEEAATTAEIETTTSVAETTTTTVAETTTEAPASTVGSALAGPADGVPFADPGGAYSLLISPEWTDASDAFPEGVVGWLTGQTSEVFQGNVNIVVDSVPASTPVEVILEAGQGQVELRFEEVSIIRSEVVAGVNHPELGISEYTAVQNGIELRFVQTIGVWGETLVVVTGSVLNDESAAANAEAVVRYALTLAPQS